MKAVTLWFTGLSGAGKTTIANELAKRIREKGKPIVVLDGDEVRKTLSSDLGYSKEERDKHITRVAHVCKLVVKNEIPVIACVISPTKKIREYARSIIPNFVEVYIKCPLEECEKRDVKGHYKKVRSGEMKEFVGITIPYEEPENPEIVIQSNIHSIDTCVKSILKRLSQLGYLH